jgi:nitrate/nitrite transporter NarK
LGLALILAGFVSFWVWSAVGALVVLLGARAWWKLSDEEISRMRRDQPIDTAVIPATPVRGSQNGS